MLDLCIVCELDGGEKRLLFRIVRRQKHTQQVAFCAYWCQVFGVLKKGPRKSAARSKYYYF